MTSWVMRWRFYLGPRGRPLCWVGVQAGWAVGGGQRDFGLWAAAGVAVHACAAAA